jgi:hypothetical protein
MDGRMGAQASGRQIQIRIYFSEHCFYIDSYPDIFEKSCFYTVDKQLGQYRIIINASTRRQIFRQMKQKAQPILDVLASIFVKYGGKSASVMAFKASAANCAVLP